MARRPKIVDQFRGGFEWLLTVYGIDGGIETPGNGWKLAAALARAHPEHALMFERLASFGVKQPKRPRGNPGTDESAQRAWTTFIVMASVEERGGSARTAARDLAALWRRDGVANVSGATLYRKYLFLKKEGLSSPALRYAGGDDGLSEEQCDRIIAGMGLEACEIAIGKKIKKQRH